MWFLSSCLHSAVSLTRVREWRFNYKNSLSLFYYMCVCVCRWGREEGDSSVVRAPDSWRKGLNPCRSGGRIIFSRVDFLFWLLFRYSFQPRVTAVARKRSRSFCQKCIWQVTAKHVYTLRMWLCMKGHGAWLYGVHRTCAEMAAVSCGTSHASV